MLRATASLLPPAALVILVLSPALPASAQQPPAAPSEEAQAEARERFGRGLELYNEGQFEAALAEFQRAYDVAPAYQVLYNLGKVYAELGDAVRSADAFEQYLSQGGDEIPADRRSEVEVALERQRARIARVVVRTNVPGSTVIVDGADVATTPLDEPLRVTAGEHVVGARAAGHDTAQRRVQLAGGVQETVELELHEMAEERGALRVDSGVPGVSILVDGEEVGATPLDGTLSLEPGTHVIEARRPGYVAERHEVEIDNGAQTDLALRMELDPQARPTELGRLRLRVPDASFVLRVDGREVDAAGGSLELPAGEHDVLLEVAEREPVRQTLEVPAESAVAFEPELEWTPAAREERLSSASTLRTWGTLLTIGGGVLLAGGGALFGVSLARRADLEEEGAQVQEMYRACPHSADDCAAEYQPEIDRINDDRTLWANVRNFSGGAAIVGAAALVGGVVMLVATPSDESIEAEARAAAEPRVRVSAGLGGLSLQGVF